MVTLSAASLTPKPASPSASASTAWPTPNLPTAKLALNAVDYMLDETGLIAVRGKQITLRPLDKVKIAEQRRRWQLLNIGVPLGLLGAFGLFRAWRRRRRYASFRTQ